MDNKGGLLIPFAIILSLFALLLGALGGNAVGRKNQAQQKVGILDVGNPSPDPQTQK